MPRYVAFLRGVMPTNAKMTELKRCFEAAGFTDVKTVLGSGNVVFNAKGGTLSSLERKAEASMRKHLGRSFYTIVRATSALCDLLETDPFAGFRVPTRRQARGHVSAQPVQNKTAIAARDSGRTRSRHNRSRDIYGLCARSEHARVHDADSKDLRR